LKLAVGQRAGPRTRRADHGAASAGTNRHRV